MIAVVQPTSADQGIGKYEQRAASILDAAAALLLKWGYKRVTMEDVASRSGIGKGTLYLHWKTKEALFQTLLLREAVHIWRSLRQHIEADPDEARPGHFFRALLLLTAERPVARALFTGDRAVLGKLASDAVGRAVESQQWLASQAFMNLLRDRGLLRTDFDLSEQQYALQATVTGFFLIPPTPADAGDTAVLRAEALRYTVRHAFEPATPLTGEALGRAAARVADWLEQLCRITEQQIRVLSGLATGDDSLSEKHP
jgi:AcrR family transcriptional regulator